MKKQLYNEKKFLVPDSPRSMATYHAKVMEDGIMKLTMHDCRSSIQLHNDLNSSEEVKEAIEKLSTLANGILDLLAFIHNNYETTPADVLSIHKEIQLKKSKDRVLKKLRHV